MKRLYHSYKTDVFCRLLKKQKLGLSKYKIKCDNQVISAFAWRHLAVLCRISSRCPLFLTYWIYLSIHSIVLITIITIAHLPVENYTPDETKYKFVIAINNVSSTDVYQFNLKQDIDVSIYFFSKSMFPHQYFSPKVTIWKKKLLINMSHYSTRMQKHGNNFTVDLHSINDFEFELNWTTEL